MKNLTWQNPEQLFVAQELINKVKSKCCGIKVELIPDESLSSATVHSNATNQFVSKSYHTKDAEGIKVLPKIILEIKDSTYI